MAGLPDYLMMGFGVAALYVGVKYGPQIVHNLQGASQQTQQPTDSSTSTDDQSQLSPSQGNQVGGAIDDSQQQVGQTRHHPVRCGPNMMVTHDGRCVPNTDTPCGSGQHLDASGNCVADSSTTSPSTTVPSGHPHMKPTNKPTPDMTAPKTSPHRYRPTRIRHQHHNGPCPDGSFPDANNNCKPIPATLQSNFGTLGHYEVAVDGPQWRKSIPYNQLVASQGMVHPGKRVGRALAANNHNFMPGGFVLSEASVRRGVNNVYSAGT